MSINHFSPDHPETQWWTTATQQEEGHFGHSQFYNNQHHNYQAWLNSHHQEASASASSMSAFQTPNAATTTLNFNLNHDDDDQNANNEAEEEDLHADADDDKELMFEKPLTPSDVGKLNRLVIPKQHAEKYFPLNGGGGDSAGEKGLLLSFEDESGKCWRFRYSYWNSSQSYVLTKGWSRYVKEKRLDAGDVVLFERRRTNSDSLFIGWRRRLQAQDSGGGGASGAAQVSGGGVGESGGVSSGSSRVGGCGAGAGWTRMFYSAHPSYPAHQYQHSVPYPPDCLHAAGSSVHPNHQTTTSGGSSSKILRLFGVNLECQLAADHESEPSTPDGSSSLSSGQGPTPTQLYPRAYFADQKDFTLSTSRDVNPMRNRRG